MPDMDGVEVLQELKRIDPDIPIIIITAYGDVDTAVEAIKLGAYDFITKPPKFDRLILTLKRAIEKSRLEMTVRWLNTAVEASLEDKQEDKGDLSLLPLKELSAIAVRDVEKRL